MNQGSSITITRSANGFIVFEQDKASLPEDPKKITTFNKIGDRYDSDGLIGFIKDHFEKRNAQEGQGTTE